MKKRSNLWLKALHRLVKNIKKRYKMFQDNLKYVYDYTKDIEVESMDVLIDEEATEVFVNKGKINFTFNNCNRGE